MDKKVIHPKNLPTRIPIVSIAVTYLFLDKFGAPGWVWGIVGTVAGLMLAGSLIAVCTVKWTDIFRKEDET